MQFLLSFINRWLGTGLPKLFLLFLGVLLVVVVIAALWDRRVKFITASIGAILGLGMTAIALEEGLVHFIGSLDPSVRIRLVAIFFSLFLLILTFFSSLKTGLQKRYAITWTAVSYITLLTALVPNYLRTFPSLLGVQFGATVASLFIFFLILLVFHFSIKISEMHKQQKVLIQKILFLESAVGQQWKVENEPVVKAVSLPYSIHKLEKIIENLLDRFEKTWRNIDSRSIRGTTLAAPLIIFLAVGGVLLTGLMAPNVMVGDEVTHFYMLQTQSHDLSKPNFYAEIPTATGGVEKRRYPHSFIWHYIGAFLYHYIGNPVVVQLYQAVFFCQLLIFAYLLARSRRGIESRSALLYLLVIASLPLSLIFSVAFYQDVPMAAQALTAFYFLKKGRWFLASCFMSLAIGMKVTAVLFFPQFFLLLLLWQFSRSTWKKAIVVFFCSACIVAGSTWSLGKAINIYGQAGFYPQEKFEMLLAVMKQSAVNYFRTDEKKQQVQNHPVMPVVKNESRGETSETTPVVIANHPGDLRNTINFFIYGGLVLWLIIVAGFVSYIIAIPCKKEKFCSYESELWLWGVGGLYMVLTAYFMWTVPDARFFLPGLIFVLLPIVEKVVCLPRPKVLISFVAALAFLQGGYVLAKTYRLRAVSPAIKEAIHYLEVHPPFAGRVFMYPEGNYRLFPAQHEWYLGYRLREFWRGDNDKRLTILQDFNLRTLVIKKHLIAQVDEEITDLGVYPLEFVKDISEDVRFKRIFENREIVIFETQKNVQE